MPLNPRCLRPALLLALLAPALAACNRTPAPAQAPAGANTALDAAAANRIRADVATLADVFDTISNRLTMPTDTARDPK